VREEAAQREALVEVQLRMLQEALRSSAADDSSERTRKTADTGSSASSCRASTSPSASPRLSTPLPSPELLASSPRAAELLASADVTSPLMLAVSTPGRAPPLSLDQADDGEEYAERWRKAQESQIATLVDSSRVHATLPPPPAVRPPPRTIEGLVGTAALSGSMAGWSHSEAQDVEELMMLEAIRLSLEHASANPGGAPEVSSSGARTLSAADDAVATDGSDGGRATTTDEPTARTGAISSPPVDVDSTVATELLNAVSATASSALLTAQPGPALCREPIAS